MDMSARTKTCTPKLPMLTQVRQNSLCRHMKQMKHIMYFEALLMSTHNMCFHGELENIHHIVLFHKSSAVFAEKKGN